MRFLNKYKTFYNTNLIINDIPNRIVKFKRPKWKKLQLVQKKTILGFNTNRIKKLNFKKWEKIKTSYKEGLLLKRSIHAFFDNNLKSLYYKKVIKALKKKFLIKIFIFHSFIKPIFRLDILLWRLNVFKSSYQASQFINNNNVLVNGVISNNCIFLKKGDIITLRNNLLHLEFDNNDKNIFSFVEIDYYTNNIIVLKDFDQLNFEDFFFFFNKTINLKKFIDYIKVK